MFNAIFNMMSGNTHATSSSVHPVIHFIQDQCMAHFNESAGRELADFGDAFKDCIDLSSSYISNAVPGQPQAVNFALILRHQVASSAGGHAVVECITPLSVRVPCDYKANPSSSVSLTVNVCPANRARGTSGALNPQATFIDPATYAVKVAQRSSTLTGYVREVEARCARCPPVPGLSPSGPFVRTEVVTASPTPREVVTQITAAARKLFYAQPDVVPGPSVDGFTCRTHILVHIRGTPCVVECDIEVNPVSAVAPIRARVKTTPQLPYLNTTASGGPCDAFGYVVRIDDSTKQQRYKSHIMSGDASFATSLLQEIADIFRSQFPASNEQPRINKQEPLLPPPATATQPAPLPTPAPTSPPQQQQHEESEETCVICLDARREYVCVPCGHRVLCSECKDRFPAGSTCPTCRTTIATTIKVFL